MTEVIMRPSQSNNEEHPINALKAELTRRVQERKQIEALMEKFTGKLFDAFETAIAQTTASGVPGLNKPRRIPHPAGDWRQALQLYIEDWSVIIVPLVGAAWPNPRDEARIAAVKFKEPCGRIALFLGDEPSAESFYDFLIFSDGSWFAWGFGWPRIDDDIDLTNFETMAFELLTAFVRDIHTTWRPRRINVNATNGTALSQSLDAKKRAYNFGLPGDE
ncbi:MAG: hypothetical protein ABI947_11155 [Chloroflexota bacterium]